MIEDKVYTLVKTLRRELKQHDEVTVSIAVTELLALLALAYAIPNRHDHYIDLVCTRAKNAARLMLEMDPKTVSAEEQMEALNLHVTGLPTRASKTKGKSPWAL